MMRNITEALFDPQATVEEFKDAVDVYLDQAYHGGNYELALGYLTQAKLDAERDFNLGKSLNIPIEFNYVLKSAEIRLAKLKDLKLC